jgi:RNA-dependent RNA polymerase
VIIFSIKGPRRAADYLSGGKYQVIYLLRLSHTFVSLGDYDGDKGVLIWQPELVQPFQNAPLSSSEEPANIDDFFTRNNETVADFQTRMKSKQPIAIVHEVQQYLLGAIHDTANVGKYSNFHINAIYKLGYRNPETIRLAYMLVNIYISTCLANPRNRCTGFARHWMALKQD